MGSRPPPVPPTIRFSSSIMVKAGLVALELDGRHLDLLPLVLHCPAPDSLKMYLLKKLQLMQIYSDVLVSGVSKMSRTPMCVSGAGQLPSAGEPLASDSLIFTSSQ